MKDHTINSADTQMLAHLPELGRQIAKDRQDKIRLLYSHGFILTPFGKSFVNPFSEKSIQPEMLTLNYKEIQDYLNSNFPKGRHDLKNLVEQLHIKNNKGHKFRMNLSRHSLQYGTYFFVFSVILHFLFKDNAEIILIPMIISTCLIYYWIAYQTAMEDQSRTATLYIEKSGAIQLFVTISILATLILIYFTYNSPLIYVVYVLYAILFGYSNLLVTRNLKNEWWNVTGIYTINEYYDRPETDVSIASKPETVKIKSTSTVITSDRTNLKEIMAAGVDFLTIIISKDQVDRNDISISNNILQQLITDVEITNHFRERIEVSFDGYDNTTKEIWEIPEVRSFVVELDSKFPYWLYFLTKNGGGLFAVLRCFLLPHLMPEADKQINGIRLKKYLDNRGFPAMNHACNIANISEAENINMTDRFFEYAQQRNL